MECPVCGDKLRPIERYGVEVDICPGCKGVWLDKGELEKVIELADKGGPSLGTAAGRDRDLGDRRDKDRDEYRREEYKKPKRRGGWLGDLLEGFGED